MKHDLVLAALTFYLLTCSLICSHCANANPKIISGLDILYVVQTVSYNICPHCDAVSKMTLKNWTSSHIALLAYLKYILNAHVQRMFNNVDNVKHYKILKTQKFLKF